MNCTKHTDCIVVFRISDNNEFWGYIPGNHILQPSSECNRNHQGGTKECIKF